MIGLTLLKDIQSKLDAFAFGEVEQMLAHIHETATSLDQHASSFDLDLADLCSNEILSRCHLGQWQTCCELLF